MPPASTVRRITPERQRNFGKIYDVHPVPDLTEIQTRSYERFLQADLPAEERDDAGLEGVFREIFPIESYDKTLKLEYIKFDLGKPRYEPDECRQLRLSYGRPLHVWLRLNKGEVALEESVYLGDMPIMIGGGEFIINGAERVVVSQLHRSPGVDFVVDIEAGDKKLHACRVIPERGSWIELQVTKKDTLGVRIDQSGKFSSMTLLRAMSPEFSSDDAILKAFYESEDIDTDKDGSAALLEGRIACGDVVDPNTGEVLIDSGSTISKVSANVLADAKIGVIGVLKDAKDPLDPPVAPGRPDDRSRERLAPDLPAAPAGQPAPAREGQGTLPREVLRHQSLPAGQGRPVPDQPEVPPGRSRRPDDPGQGRTTSTRSATSSTFARARGRSTTSTTWATAGSGRSTSWPPTNCGKASSSSAGPSRSG